MWDIRFHTNQFRLTFGKRLDNNPYETGHHHEEGAIVTFKRKEQGYKRSWYNLTLEPSPDFDIY